jgi:LPS sulfotransferase NodH
MKPHISYVICATQRSGSSLLCESLKNTGLAGMPEEYFLNGEGWEGGEWAHQNGVISRSDYLRLVFEKGTTPNGVFGTKVMWNYFPTMLKSLREFPEYERMEPAQLMASLFTNVQYIWITRRDKVRQAVSWARAGQTDVYAWPKGETPIPKREPEFDFVFIDNLCNLINEGEAGWLSFFKACKVRPFEVIYEELVENYEATALRILEYLHISYPKDLVFGERRLQKQSDSLNEVWVEKYLDLKQLKKERAQLAAGDMAQGCEQ